MVEFEGPWSFILLKACMHAMQNVTGLFELLADEGHDRTKVEVLSVLRTLSSFEEVIPLICSAAPLLTSLLKSAQPPWSRITKKVKSPNWKNQNRWSCKKMTVLQSSDAGDA